MLSVGSEAGTSWGENNLLQAIPDAARLVPLMVGRLMETDRAFQKQRRGRKPALAGRMTGVGD
ncbi:DUF2274 domain-containing protein [Acetobacter sp. AAB5]|uniref:DUF2274 domain-containing protein n=1 Tax=Acetobacter sp. AAB5 TaxID=3418370 RepID=UPI003CF6E230